MFSNIGRKIKTLAKVLCWIGIILSVLGGVFGVALNPSIAITPTPSGGFGGLAYKSNGVNLASALVGLAIIVLGSLISWAGSFALYGFGQLVENSDKLVDR